MKHALSILLLLILTGTASADADAFDTMVRPFLEQHCLACHGPETQKAGIRYDSLKGYDPKDRHLWTLVHGKLSAGEMPPKSRPQPTAEARQRLLTWIEQEQRAQRAGNTRRLNRRELAAALRDVTGLSVDYAEALPEDGKVDGFDTGAEGLQDAADSVARVMEVTRRSVQGIRFLGPAPGKVLTADLRDVKDLRKAFDSWTAQGANVKPRGIVQPGVGVLIEPKWLGDRDGFSFHLPPPPGGRGLLRLKLVVSMRKGDFKGIPNPHLWVEVGGNIIDYREMTGTTLEPHELIYEVQVEDLAIDSKGLGVTLYNKVEMPYAVAGFANEDRNRPGEEIPGGTGLFRPAFDRKLRLPPEKQPVPFVVLHHMEVTLNHVAAWPPAEWMAEVGEIGDNEESARRLLALWMNRAWRRPASVTEQQRFFVLYQKVRGQGLDFDDALRAAFHSVLLSAPFRYLSSPGDPADAQHAIASRLSFMLSGAPPDAELRRLAAAGKLRDAAVLDAQVDRLLADLRSDAFLRPFVMQWLEMGQPITVAMDHLQKQDFRFGRFLKASLQEETVAYVGQLLADNRPARELIQSDWTMMNNAVARHYGYEGIEGGHFRKVTLQGNDPRGGGVLGHAGIQSMLCWMGDNWVIYRGAWALRHILDDPPPPPPLEVPELIPSDAANRGKTFKQLLEQHQQDARCAICHQKMDPLGFAFQNFDLSGRWREVEHESYKREELDGKIAWYGTGKTRPVDSAGQLPRGEKFTSFAECKQLIVKNYQEDLVRGLLKNFMLYATGRRPDVADMAELRAIMKQLEPRGYPVRDLVKAVVRSRAFLDN